MAKKTENKPVIDPFKKIASTKEKKAGGLDHVNSADEVTKAAVDEYKRIAGEMKRLEGEQAAHKAVVEGYARKTFCERQVKNTSGNFYVDGNADVVMYQAQNANAGIAADGYATIVEEHGEEAAEELLMLDTASVKFNADKLKEPGVMEKFVAALQVLPPEILNDLFTAATYKVTEDVFVKMRSHAETAEEFQALMASLKIKNFIKA